MTPATLFHALALPPATHLGKRVFKKLFLERPDVTAADRRALDPVTTVTWQYALKPDTVPVAGKSDAERDYPEVAVLEVAVEPTAASGPPATLALRAAEVVHRAIPYPLVLALTDGRTTALSLAPKRRSRDGRDAIVVESFLHGPFLDDAAPAPAHDAFLASLAWSELPKADFFALYQALVDRLVALQCATLGGAYRLVPELSTDARRERLAAVQALGRELAGLRAAFHKEHDLARKMAIHTRLKQIERQHHGALTDL